MSSEYVEQKNAITNGQKARSADELENPWGLWEIDSKRYSDNQGRRGDRDESNNKISPRALKVQSQASASGIFPDDKSRSMKRGLSFRPREKIEDRDRRDRESYPFGLATGTKKFEVKKDRLYSFIAKKKTDSDNEDHTEENKDLVAQDDFIDFVTKKKPNKNWLKKILSK